MPVIGRSLEGRDCGAVQGYFILAGTAMPDQLGMLAAILKVRPRW